MTSCNRSTQSPYRHHLADEMACGRLPASLPPFHPRTRSESITISHMHAAIFAPLRRRRANEPPTDVACSPLPLSFPSVVPLFLLAVYAAIFDFTRKMRNRQHRDETHESERARADAGGYKMPRSGPQDFCHTRKLMVKNIN